MINLFVCLFVLVSCSLFIYFFSEYVFDTFHDGYDYNHSLIIIIMTIMIMINNE